MPPTSPSNNVHQPSPPNGEFLPLGPSGQQNIIHPPIVPPPTANYLPQFPFGPHPELLQKSPFLPYDLHALRTSAAAAAAVAARSIQINASTTVSGTSLPHPGTDHRLSPTSSRPSSSSPISSQQSHLSKINSSIEINSTNEQSCTDDSDDEQIDVVKSAFVPILRPSPAQQTKLELADSTTNSTSAAVLPIDLIAKQETTEILTTRPRCELKAPSALKTVHHHQINQTHETTRPRSPDTKLKPTTITTQKTVWRPY